MAMGSRYRGAGVAGTRQQRSNVRPVYEDFKPISQWVNEPGAEILHLHLPGFVKEQIKILAEISSSLLRVRGERFVSGNRWIRFNEEVPVPEHCNINEIRAKFEGGTLKITMPKVTPSQPPSAEQPKVSGPQQQLLQPPPPPPTRPQPVPQAQPRPQPVPQVQPRPQPVPQVQPRPRHQHVPQAQPRPRPLPQAQPRPQPVPQAPTRPQPIPFGAQPRPQPVLQAPTRPQHVPQPRHSPRKPGPQPTSTQKLSEDSPQKAALPSTSEQQKTEATSHPFPFDVPRYEKNLQDNLVHDGSVPPKAAFDRSENIRDHHEKSPTRSNLPNYEEEKGRDAKIGDQEHETYKQKLKKSTEAELLMKRKGNASQEQEHVTSTEAKGKFKVEDYKNTMKKLSRNLNEDRQMLMNMGVAALVLVGLGAYISYTISGSSGNSMD